MSTQQSKQVGEKRNAPEGTSTPPTKLPKVAEVSKPETSKKTFHHLNHKFLFFVVSEHSGPSDVIAYFQWWSTKDRPLSQKEQNLWNNAFQIIDDQGISGTILFKDNETEEALCVKLSSNYNIPPAPAEIIAAQIHKLKANMIIAEKHQEAETLFKRIKKRIDEHITGDPLKHLKLSTWFAKATYEREEAVDEFLNSLYFKPWETDVEKSRIVPVIGLLASSGAGKTHFLDHLFEKLVKEPTKYFPIYISFNNNTTFDKNENGDIFVQRILYALLEETNWEKFRKHDYSAIELDSLMGIISTTCSDSKCLPVLLVDEVVKLDTLGPETFSKIESTVRRILRKNNIPSAWSTFDTYLEGLPDSPQVSRIGNPFIQKFSKYSRSVLTWVPINNLKHPEKITQFSAYLANPEVKSIFSLLNGHCRSLELLLSVLMSVASPKNICAQGLSTQLVGKLGEYYFSYTERELLSTEGWWEVLRAIVFGKTVKLNGTIPRTEHKWQSLIPPAVILNSIDTATLFRDKRLQVNFFMLNLRIERLDSSTLVKQLWCDLYSTMADVKNNWQTFEKFHMRLECLRILLLCDEKLTGITIEDLYPNANYYPNGEPPKRTRNKHPKFTSHDTSTVSLRPYFNTLAETKIEFSISAPVKELKDHKELCESLQEEGIYLCAPNTDGFDGFIIGKKADTATRIFVFFEMKSVESQDSTTKLKPKDYANKITNLREALKKLEISIPDEDMIYVIISRQNVALKPEGSLFIRELNFGGTFLVLSNEYLMENVYRGFADWFRYN